MNYLSKKGITILLVLVYIFGMVCFIHADFKVNNEQNSSTDQINIKLVPYGSYGTTTVNIGLDKSENSNYGFGFQLLFGNKKNDVTINLGLDLAYICMSNVYGNDLNRSTTYIQALFVNEVVVYAGLKIR